MCLIEPPRRCFAASSQVDALASALAILHDHLAEHLGREPERETNEGPSHDQRKVLEVLLETTFGERCSTYASLPLVHGPCTDHKEDHSKGLEEGRNGYSATHDGLRVLGSCLLRPPRYNAKFLPQEYSLLHKVWSLFRGEGMSNCGVLDIGAGNANCAVLIAALLGLTVICVERESPRKELRAEEQLPEALKRKVIRIEKDIEDFDIATLQSLASRHNLKRFVLLAKHPCGIGVDRSIDCAVKLRKSSRASIPSLPSLRAEPQETQHTQPSDLPQLLGVVIACCCTNKLSLDDFRESRVEEFCTANAAVDPAGLPSKTDALVRAVEVMSKCSAWRSTSGSLGNAITSEQVSWV